MSADQPLPIPKTKEERITQTDQRTDNNSQLTDIFVYYSKEALEIIKLACNEAKKRKLSVVTPVSILDSLMTKDEISTNIGDNLLTKLQTEIEVQISKEEKNFTGLVNLSPETKKILIGAYFISKQDSALQVLNKHLFLALSVYPDLEPLFSDIDLNGISQNNFSISQSMGKYTTDLTEFSKDQTKVYLDRKNELDSMVRILIRENKHHIILLGEDGVGKSTLGIALAQFLSAQKFSSLENTRVVSLDAGSLFALSLETNGESISKITEEVGTFGKIIFFFDNVDLLRTTLQMSQMVEFLRNLEKRGSVCFVVPTTPVFYKEFLATNPYFTSSFDSIKVEEVSTTSTENILVTESDRIEKLYKVTIDKDVFKDTVSLAKRYLPGSLPLKAISLLEETCASVLLTDKKEVTLNDVRNIVAQKTGIPIGSLTESEIEKLKDLEGILGQYVIGQKEAVIKVSEAIRRARVGLKDTKKPTGSFLFLGPTGVGKTELAKTLAKTIFNDEKSFLRFDMSEYAESHTAQRLIGSPPGYVGYEEGGQLTNAVIERPYSLILFDEIEKAHPRVFDLFLQVLDDGRLTDSQGRVVDFRNTLLIFTSNIASQEIFDHSSEKRETAQSKIDFLENIIMPVVRQYFRPEFINRFDDIIMFNPLSKSELLDIAKLKIKQMNLKLVENQINFEISDEKLQKIVDDSYNPAFGARSLERAIKEKIENVIAKQIIYDEVKKGETVKW
ncbi:MAG: ATP-dependent Clp protease ATP-binding subunit [Candidatus Shapirobacteria bacterium]